MEDIIKTFFQELSENLYIDYYYLDIVNEGPNIYLLKIKTEDSSILIGIHWKNLQAIEYILNLLFYRKYRKKIRLNLEINDYILYREERLKKHIIAKIAFAKKILRDVDLGPISPYERKKAHFYVAELWDPDIYTKSIWNWDERRLYICLKDVNSNNKSEDQT